MIQVENLIKRYHKDGKDILALNDFSLPVNYGDFIAIQGASGSGKTTLLLATGGLLHPDNGNVIINNVNIYNLSAEERALFRAQHIGFVFQQYHLIPYLTVFENIKLPALALKRKVPQSKLKDLISILGLESRFKHTPSELSAGEKQRTALARALLFNPSILLADEITGNLDEVNTEIVMNCLADYKQSGGTILLVSHDKDICTKADKLICLQNGEKVNC